MMEIDNLILGAGIAGMAAGQKLWEENKEFLIIEKENFYGGLCSSFSVEGFLFDYFIHMSFTSDADVRRYFDLTPYYIHKPNPCNYYHGIWIKHPAINNLYPLNDEEKKLILDDLRNRSKYVVDYDKNYDKWLRFQFGDYFAEHFSLAYTRKYWVADAADMETEWVGNRIYQPAMDEILNGMKTNDTPITYYAREMRFPRAGGFSSFLNSIVHDNQINLNEKVLRINADNKTVVTSKDTYRYNKLFSSIPIPELNRILSLKTSSYDIFNESIKQLHWTGGYLVSLGIRGRLGRNDLWDYIYDEDILVSRYYSPSLMSPSTSPEGFSSVQAEIYTRDGKELDYKREELLDIVINQLSLIGVFDKNNVVVKDIRYVKYCNILFDHNIYSAKSKAAGILEENAICSIGRFGKWDYFWSDQAFLSGYKAVLFT